MVRPRKTRKVSFFPEVYFKPSSKFVNEISLKVDEFEALRLKDTEGLEQIEASRKMGISQPTFHRLLLDARKKVSDAIVNGKAIKVKGGDFILR